jgi:hypothetical protein
MLAIASLSSPWLDANPFLLLATMCLFIRRFLFGRVEAMAPEPRLWESAVRFESMPVDDLH